MYARVVPEVVHFRLSSIGMIRFRTVLSIKFNPAALYSYNSFSTLALTKTPNIKLIGGCANSGQHRKCTRDEVFRFNRARSGIGVGFFSFY